MESLSINALIWVGILFCISQSAMFSGLNLALLGISRLRLTCLPQSLFHVFKDVFQARAFS